MVWVWIIIVGIVAWIVLSIKGVPPDKQGVLVIFSKPKKRLGPGYHFVPKLPGCYIVQYPLKIYDLDYPKREVITKAGDYKGKYYGSQVVKVDSVVYLRFPRNNNLVRILQSGVPSDDKKVLDWTEEAVLSALRAVFSEMTWKEAIENIHKVRDDTERIFKSADGVLIMAGFNPEDIKLAIIEIRLPPELEKALPILDQKRIESESAKFEAKKRAISVIGMILESMARARGKTIKEIQREIDSNKDLKKEFIKRVFDLLERQMAIDGNSFFDFRNPDSQGNLFGLIAEAIALWEKRGGAKKEGKADRETKDLANKKTEDLTDEELEKEVNKILFKE